MLLIIFPIVVATILSIIVYFKADEYDRGFDAVMTFIFGNLIGLLVFGLWGQLITSEIDSNYTVTTRTHELTEISPGKYALLGDGKVTWRTDDVVTRDYQNVSFQKGGEAKVVVTKYEPNHTWTYFGRETQYKVILPDGGLDY